MFMIMIVVIMITKFIRFVINYWHGEVTVFNSRSFLRHMQLPNYGYQGFFLGDKGNQILELSSNNHPTPGITTHRVFRPHEPILKILVLAP